MTSKGKPISRGHRRYHLENVLAAHTVPVAVSFRLYDKLDSSGNVGAFKPKRRGVAQSEAFWIYFFQDSWDKSIQLTHEIYVDTQGVYNHVDCQGDRDIPNRPPGIDPYRSVLLSSAHYQKGERRAYGYYVLFSLFQIPSSRLDYILPGGTIAKEQAGQRKQFLDWTKARDLNLLSFSPAEERRGAIRDLWVPWLKAQAMADDYDAAVHQYAKRYLDREDEFRVADIVGSLSKLCNLSDHVSMENVKALYAEIPRVLKPCQAASDRITEYLDTAAIQEMILDMWADNSEAAHDALFPYLSNFYHAARTERLLDWVDTRFLEHQIDVPGIAGSKVTRRTTKALWEINAMFAKALTKHRPGPSGALDAYVRGTRWYAKNVFRMELNWTGKSWDVTQIERIKRMAGGAHLFLTFLHCLDTINVISAYAALMKDPTSVRNYVGLMGACASQVSTVLKTIEAMTTPTDILDKRLLVASAEKYFGSQRAEMLRVVGIAPTEAPLLKSLARREEVLKSLRALRNKTLATGLGLVSGVSDSVTAAFDLVQAWQIGDRRVAISLGLVVVGGALVAASVFGLPVWAAAAGQVLELAGLIGAGIFQSTDFELWLRFCCFGNHSTSTDVSVKRRWTGGLTLGQLAGASPQTQIRAFYDIVYDMDITARRVHFERIKDQFDLSVSFSYACPKEGQVYLRIVLANRDGTTSIFRPLSPWKNPIRKLASDKKTVVGFSEMFDGADVLQGVKSIDVAIWLDVNRNLEFFPEKPLIKTFEVDALASVG